MYDNFNSKKYMILLIFICIVFTVFVIKAFDYLPENQSDSGITEKINTISKTQVDKNNVKVYSEQQNVEETGVRYQKSGVLYRSENSLHDEVSMQNERKLEEVKAPAGALYEEIVEPESDTKTEENKLSNEELALKAIISARKYVSTGDYSTAIQNYQKVAEFTKDNELLAESYDGLALLYTKNKRFGTALSFAGKAYNSSPSITREFFIARIYYLAGQTDTAISRINSMLKRNLN